VHDVAARLCHYTDSIRLYVIPFTKVQLFLNEFVQAEKLTLLLKRAMLQIASRLARLENASQLPYHRR
jgi:thiamine biosynthesis protein ThiI